MDICAIVLRVQSSRASLELTVSVFGRSSENSYSACDIGNTLELAKFLTGS